MSEFSIRTLVEEGAGSELELHGRTINPQFLRMLRTIGFDRHWARGEGAYLYDADGNRFLDMLGGFGMYNVGRSNPRVRAALHETLDLELPGRVALGITQPAGALAEALLERAPSGLGRVLFTSSGAESIEAAIKIGRAATGRSRVVSVEHGFHGLTLGALSANGGDAFTSRFAPLVPGFSHVPFNDLDALEAELRTEDVAMFVTEPIVGHGVRLPEPGYLEGAQALCRTLRHALLRRRGGDRLRPHRAAVRMRALGARARRDDGVEGALRRLRPDRRDAVHAGGVRRRLRLDGARAQPRVDVRAERPRRRRRPRHAPRARVGGAGRAGGAHRRRCCSSARARSIERYGVVRDVRGLGLFWAIEFGEPGSSTTWRMLERLQPGIFSQLVVVPLFSDHRVLIQVAGHNMNVVRAMPPLVLSEEDVDWFADALDQVVARAQKMPSAMTRFALKAARAGRPRVRAAR